MENVEILLRFLKRGMRHEKDQVTKAYFFCSLLCADHIGPGTDCVPAFEQLEAASRRGEKFLYVTSSLWEHRGNDAGAV